jgi:hypothetical protein
MVMAIEYGSSPRRAAGAPQPQAPQPAAGRPLLGLPDHLLGQKLEVMILAEEVGFIGRNAIDQFAALVSMGRLRDILEVCAIAREPEGSANVWPTAPAPAYAWSP